MMHFWGYHSHTLSPITGKFGTRQLTYALPFYTKFHMDRMKPKTNVTDLEYSAATTPGWVW